ncbi:MAG TPA: GIY-YIG nuclease family protein [Candidatus Merdenecus merdavium]|nr:GIY-YIG nuclease family protein [Candidatus Merdenecus merdavium]
MNYTYIVECKDKTLYTGWTNDINKRLLDHENGKGAKYTKGRAPITLVYLEEFQSKQEAMSREYHIKKLSKSEKLKLIKTYQEHHKDHR